MSQESLPSARIALRLEDVVPLWREQTAALIATGTKEITRHTEAALPVEENHEIDNLAFRLSEIVNTHAVEFAQERLLPTCLSWFQEKEYWANPGEANIELRRALASLPRFQPVLPQGEVESAPKSKAWAAGIGAFAGSSLLGLITFAILGNREPGLLFGAPLGAAALVYFLASRSFTIPLPFPLSFIVQRRIVPPPRAVYIERITDQIRRLLLHDADLVLALCWGHPDRWVQMKEESTRVSGNEPLSVYETVGTLRMILRRQAVDHQELRDVTEELLQRFEDEGFQWKVIEDGTLYDESMDTEFRKSGVINSGHKVKTLREALLRKRMVVSPGLIGRMRN